MPVTPQDWRVTAQQEVTRSLTHVERATSADDLDSLDVLRECWAAYRSAGAAVGSWAQGMAAGGRSWSEIGAALDLPEHEVAGALQPLVAQGWQTLTERLPDATAAEAPPAAAQPRRLPWVADGPAVPLRHLEGDLAKRVAGLGARQVNLYRSLAHTPELLDAWIDWAWALRGACTTPRSLRELMILRTAIVMRSEYEWHQHEAMALDAGVSREQVDALTAWQVSDLFDRREKAALTLTDAMLTGNVPDAVHEELRRHFDDSDRLELVLTAGFYAMVPRVLDALRVPVEGSRMPDRVLVLNGPNLNLLGTREPEIYGTATLADVEQLCHDTAAGLGLTVDFRQSNAEGTLIDAVQEARTTSAGLVINPAGYSHTSIALMDALSACAMPIVEVHLSNIHRREEFRHLSYVSKVAGAVIAGCGVQGYAFALQHVAAQLPTGRT